MVTVSLGNFTKAVDKLLEEYQSDVTEAIENGLDESQQLLIDSLKAPDASPVGKSSDHYRDHWKAGENKKKGYRTVKNDKLVPMRKQTLKIAHDSHLAGILEYSTHHNHPHIKKTQKRVRRKIFNILKNHIKNGA